MILYIAEKPSLGRAIADVLPKPHRKAEGCIYAANGDCVTWCIGHLLAQADPDVYNPAFKQWRFEDLPIVPEQWQLTAKPATKKQLTVLRRLVKEAGQIVHAGDPDREGQLMVDQVLAYLGISAQKKTTLQRCLISDLNPAAVRRSIAQLRPNKDFVALSVSALARVRADWLYGINMTRAYTLHGRKVGYQGVLSVGRVQTPLLGLVVRRDQAIADFVEKPFYQVQALLETAAGEGFYAKWQPSEACQPYMDDDGRVLSRRLAAKVVERISGQPATISSITERHRRQSPPLPHSLSSLQIEAAKRFGMSAQQVLDTCQSLYERHQLLTYPRSDNRYLPEQHYQQRHAVLAAIADNQPSLREAIEAADRSLKTKAWNDQQVAAHHAIIPTEKKSSKLSLTSAERNIYQLVARQYLAQFYCAYEYKETDVNIVISGGEFKASAKVPLIIGWKNLYERAKPSTAANQEEGLGDNAGLPSLQKSQLLQCIKGLVIEKTTTPPKHFDDASLLMAMTGIARYVNNHELKAVLKETDGLGTEATRAGIIELLFKRGYLQRQAKSIRSTQAGIGLIKSLPMSATLPDMTAQWEMQLEAISQRQMTYDGFMQPLYLSLEQLISQSKNQSLASLQGVSASTKAAKTQKGRFKKKRAKAAA